MPQWDPSQYLRFERQRTQPCIDLVSRIEIESVGDAVDLGCGPGNSTGILAKRFAAARIVGIDSSAAMIERARRDYPQITFAQADATSWKCDPPCDVILANAVF